ncbi:MAG: ATPase [Spirochaetaceae bacterium]|jgi:V/A-type H+-transporting ATPase subunit I|nr:ATPase [Spirochaetaceae bacterium]
MIVPMKKVSIVVLDRERKTALKKLRSLGVLHPEKVEGAGSDLAAFRDSYGKIESALTILENVKVPKNRKSAKQVPAEQVPAENKPPFSLSPEEVLKKAEHVLALGAEKKALEEDIQKNNRELDRFSKWGDVDPADIAWLAEKGLRFFLYEIPLEKYADIPEAVSTVEVNSDRQDMRFLAFTLDGTRPQDMPADAFFVSLPEKSTRACREENSAAAARIEQIGEETAASVIYLEAFKKTLLFFGKEIEFETIHSGMDGDAEESNGKKWNALAWLTGYLPASELGKFRKAAAEEQWAMSADDPGEEDEVPTLLKNSKLVSLIDPVMDFLGTVPGYREYDISNWFLLFFAIFFGMIFGDGGYGALLVLAAIGGIISSVSKGKGAPQAMMLLLLLGITTMIWGTLTCSWFGIPTEQLPGFFRDISLPLFTGEDPVRNTQNLQIFCFTLALVQLSIAHIKGIVRNIRSPKFLGDLGSLLLLWGMYTVVLSMVVSSERFPMSNVTFILAGTGFALSFIFANYEGSVGKSILESLKNIVSVLLGVVNVFSDIVSYIRLWAVALAGGAIANTVNTMAGPTLGNALIFAGVLLLAFGHGLNMVLNVLSVIVHGVRLNTLEFTSHLGMSWSGFKYAPFREEAS